MIKNSFRTLMVSSAMLMGLANSAFSTVVTVPDGTFTSTTNMGTIGGGLLTGSASDQTIGTTGPWLGTYIGDLGLLAPPSLSITTGLATISGVADLNVAGLVYSGGDFTTTLTSAGSGSNYAYANDTLYTLTANVSASTLLGVTALATDGVGIALTSNGNIIASSTMTNAPVTLTLLSGTTYALTLNYATPITSGPTGAIGIELYDLPNNTVTASVLSSVSFSNVSLNLSAAPEPAVFLLSGAGLLALGFIHRRKSQPRS